MKQFLKLAVLAGLAGFSLNASAETYNFYFDSNAPAPANAAAPAKSVEVARPVEPQVQSNFDRSHRWTLGASAFAGRRDSGSDVATDTNSAFGLMIAPNFAVTESLRLNAFFGKALAAGPGYPPTLFGGGEAQLLPLHFGLGSSLHMIDLGGLLGMSTFHKVGDNIGSLHIGPMVSARVSRTITLISAVRANLGSLVFDAGASIRL